jgi:predicted Zn-dependent protease
LQALARRIDPEAEARSIRIANIPMNNAIALPGRHVILFRGLVEQAASPDEVAGVLAHELGHVRQRHILTAMIRQMGLSVLLGGTGGSDQINSMMSMAYSREAEHAADMHALKRLQAAGISTRPLAMFFARLSPKGTQAAGSWDKVPAWLSTHPSSTSREAMFDRVKTGKTTVALDAAQWEALRSMCHQDRKVKSGWNAIL